MKKLRHHSVAELTPLHGRVDTTRWQRLSSEIRPISFYYILLKKRALTGLFFSLAERAFKRGFTRGYTCFREPLREVLNACHRKGSLTLTDGLTIHRLTGVERAIMDRIMTFCLIFKESI